MACSRANFTFTFTVAQSSTDVMCPMKELCSCHWIRVSVCLFCPCLVYTYWKDNTKDDRKRIVCVDVYGVGVSSVLVLVNCLSRRAARTQLAASVVMVRLIPSSCPYLKWLAGPKSLRAEARVWTLWKRLQFFTTKTSSCSVAAGSSGPAAFVHGVANGKCLCLSLLIRWGATLTSPHLGVLWEAAVFPAD